MWVGNWRFQVYSKKGAAICAASATHPEESADFAHHRRGEELHSVAEMLESDFYVGDNPLKNTSKGIHMQVDEYFLIPNADFWW